jgi:hypothetical protein
MAPAAALVAALLAFASHVSGYSIPAGDTPVIHMVSEDPVMHHKLSRHAPEYGMTNKDTGEIYLSTEWRGDREDNCVLAHELTHWLQMKHRRFLTGLSVPRSEVEAYHTTLACFQAYHMPSGQIAWAREMVQHPHVATQ